MTPQEVITIGQEAVYVAVLVSAPLLLTALLVGLVISILQAITSIQDQALTFVPKIVAMILVAAALISWIAERLITYTAELLTLSP